MKGCKTPGIVGYMEKLASFYCHRGPVQGPPPSWDQETGFEEEHEALFIGGFPEKAVSGNPDSFDRETASTIQFI